MELTLFHWINIIAGVILLSLLASLAWNVWISAADHPKAWIIARQNGSISKRLVHKSRTYPDKTRFFSWWLQVERLKQEEVPGAFAELGVYKGDSALIISLMDPERSFHLFDTFEGFRKSDLEFEKGEAATYSHRDFADTNIHMVRNRFQCNQNIIFHKGYFSETKLDAEDERFALVSLDADLYMPTKEALEFFYPRLEPGGIIFIHDYNRKWEGIQRAVDEFVQTIPECVVMVPDADSTVIIKKNKSRP